MILTENPFYILSVTPSDDRQTILAACDEKSLFSDSEKCQRARDTLLNPNRRLSAELSWLLGCSKQRAMEIIGHISSERPLEGLGLDKLSDIARLNALQSAFDAAQHPGYFAMADAILTIDQAFTSVDGAKTVLLINNGRIAAGFPIVEELQVLNELPSMRREIRSVLNKKLNAMDQGEYNQLITRCVEARRVGEYEIRPLLDDCISDYELITQAARVSLKEEIWNLASHIRKNHAILKVDTYVDLLIQKTTLWSFMDKPMQLLARAKGKFEDSGDLCEVIRELALELHQFHQTQAAVRLLNMLRRAFSDLGELQKQVKRDIDALLGFQAEQEAREREEEAARERKRQAEEQAREQRKREEAENRERIKREDEEAQRHNRENKYYTVTIDSQKVVVPPYCTCCMKPTNNTQTISDTASEQRGNTQTTRTLSLQTPLCEECAEHQKSAALRSWAVSFPAAFIGIASVSILLNYGNGEAFLWSMLATVVVFFALSLLVRFPKLKDEHSAHKASAVMQDTDVSGHVATYTFTNYRYARLFAQLNHASLIEWDRRNRVKSKAFLFASDKPFRSLVVPLVLTCVAFVAFSGSKTPSYEAYKAGTPAPIATATIADTPDPDTKLKKQEFPKNGYIFLKSKKLKYVASLTVETLGENSYYVKLVNTKTDKTDLTFFIRPGMTVDMKVPLGTYQIRYAIGSTWYGEKNLFGAKTAYFYAGSTLDFYQDSEYVYGHTLKLYQLENGNLQEYPTDAEHF